ncbi:MAG: PTS sugar transporter subunit IIB [Spirochaetaceae bacterium]
MIKVLAICGNGMGTSLVIKMKVKKYLDANNIKAEMLSCSLAEAKGFISQGIDIALCSAQLAKNVDAPERTTLLGLKNLMDDKEFGPLLLETVKTRFPNEISG